MTVAKVLLLTCAGRYGKDQAPGVSVFNFFHNEEVGSPEHLGLVSMTGCVERRCLPEGQTSCAAPGSCTHCKTSPSCPGHGL